MNSRFMHIIKRPIINEKTIALASQNKYVFEVSCDATKVEIGQALSLLLKELYPHSKSKVEKVNTAPIRARFRRTKRHGRFPSDGKKAIVTISGDPLEIFMA